MFGIIGNLFVRFFYQPFFNLLVGIYYVLNFLFPGKADMGVAVIIFTIIFRIIWLPMSLSSDRSEKEQREISEKFKKIKEQYKNSPVKEKQEVKKLMKGNRRIIVFSTINIAFQIMIALMLYRIFSSGLEGADFHLLYPFMPKVSSPFNLIFLGRFDLNHPNITLNIIQTLLIFAVELFSVIFSPFPATKQDFTTVFTFPLLAYFFFSLMPAGKKLFIITTFSFTFVLMIVKKIIFVYHTLIDKVGNLPLNLKKFREQRKNGI